MDTKKLEVKKRIMFIKNEDYYFLLYNILICLKFFQCFNEKKVFHDARKLSSIIYFMSSYEYTNIFCRSLKARKISNYEKSILTDVYSKSKIIINDVYKILFTLSKRNDLCLVKGKNNNLDIYIKENKILDDFFETSLFDEELSNLVLIKQSMNRFRTLKYETYIDKVFKSNGVGLWDV